MTRPTARSGLFPSLNAYTSYGFWDVTFPRNESPGTIPLFPSPNPRSSYLHLLAPDVEYVVLLRTYCDNRDSHSLDCAVGWNARLSVTIPLHEVFRFFKGLGGVEGRRTCQTTKKAVSSQLDTRVPKSKKGGYGLCLGSVKIGNFG